MQFLNAWRFAKFFIKSLFKLMFEAKRSFDHYCQLTCDSCIMRIYFGKMREHCTAQICSLVLLSIGFAANGQRRDSVTMIDSWHYSSIFGEIRNYRIFFPPGYSNSSKRYPVIYFLHGWSQRYFGDAGQNLEEFDKGSDNNGDNIANFVFTHDVIVVKSDGYNRAPNEKYYLRPYNIGPVETSRQFPIYYPELVDYIDAHYKTIADRQHRAISGLSMGGFMTFWIGGKYPDLFCAAGSFCGSPEFIVGPKDFPVEYRHLDMFKNYTGMNVRLNYGDKDFIRSYHKDMNRIWPQIMDNYQYKIYNAEHSTCGLGEMFSFLVASFQNTPARPPRWDHADVYPEFSVWDYHVSTDRDMAGFTLLENVDKSGFRCSVRNFLPDGELLPFVNVIVTTAPQYEKNKPYLINDIDIKNPHVVTKTITSDNEGRLRISINGSMHEIGISKQNDIPNLTIASVKVQNMRWATTGKDVAIFITILNKGSSGGRDVHAALSATRKSANVIQGQAEFDSIDLNATRTCNKPFVFHVSSDSIEIERFKLTLRDANNNQWVEFFDVPMRRTLPEIKNFEIADGRTFTVTKSAVDSETVLLGRGNGDGVANPGESIVLLVKDQNRYWRTNSVSSDEFVNPFGINVRKSDDWTDFDHVGASAKYTIPLIASGCPTNRVIEFYSEYWLPEYPLHIIKRGVIRIHVNGRDSTAPQISWIRLTGDNTLQVKLYDGSKIEAVKAKLMQKDNREKSFEFELTDDGVAGDRAKADNVFSKKIRQQNFGLYKIVIEASDSFGNKLIQESPGEFVLH